MTVSPPNINVKNLRLRHSNTDIFNTFSLEIKAGLWTCILGQSGVGKSTLLRAIAGLENKSKIDGEITFDVKGSSIAYMGQNSFLLPWLNVLDNVMLGSRLRGEKSNSDLAKDLLSQVGLEKEITSKPNQLSGGMRQRCALARTMMESRPIVLMDEPFSALDAITRHQIQNLTRDLFKDKTVLLVTHDPLEALRLGDEIVILEGCPARALPSMRLNGTAPRNIADPELLQHHPILMNKLANAGNFHHEI